MASSGEAALGEAEVGAGLCGAYGVTAEAFGSEGLFGVNSGLGCGES